MDKSLMWKEEPSRLTARDLDSLLLHCVNINASDITIQTDEEIFCEVYGKLIRVTKRRMTSPEVAEIVTTLYLSESGVPQLNGGKDLDFPYEIKPDRNKRLRFRVNATAVSVQGHTGIQITLRTIPGIPPDIKNLNIEPEVLANFAPKQGLVLVTGATGSGKSTLLAGCLRWLSEDPNSNRKILTYEHPIEFVYDEVEKPSTIIAQTEIGRHLPSFAAGVRNALRRKPMIILVGEARDAETIGECVTASMTGHLTYSTVHSNGVADTIRRMVNVFPEGEKHARAIDIVTSLKMIVSQMLVPSTDGKRVALREYLVFNDTIVDELLAAGVDQMTLVARNIVKKHGKTFLMDAEEKFKAGRIDAHQLNVIRALSKGVDVDADDASKVKVKASIFDAEASVKSINTEEVEAASDVESFDLEKEFAVIQKERMPTFGAVEVKSAPLIESEPERKIGSVPRVGKGIESQKGLAKSVSSAVAKNIKPTVPVKSALPKPIVKSATPVAHKTTADSKGWASLPKSSGVIKPSKKNDGESDKN